MSIKFFGTDQAAEPSSPAVLHDQSGFSAHEPRPKLELLQLALVGNACFSGLCGFVFLLFAPLLGRHTGLSVEVVTMSLTILGSVLVGYSLVLCLLGMQRTPPARLVWIVLVLDILWVVLSGVLLLVLPEINQFGRLVLIALAAVVALFALFQCIGLRRHQPATDGKSGAVSEEHTTVFNDVVVSWMALDLWIKVWLILLNLVFLGAIAFVGQDEFAVWTLLLYVLTGPFLTIFMVQQRGLSRLLGLAHILPWSPLFVYLVFRMTASTALGAEISYSATPLLWSYVVVLLVTIGICLGFDYWDVIRWFKGERYIAGADIPTQPR